MIAAINGVAAGGGLSLALLADFRFASETARLTTVFVRRGLCADGGMTATLPRLVGIAKAVELLMTGDDVVADEAARIGLVDRVVAPERLLAEVKDFAARLAAGPPIALSFIKRAVNRTMLSDLENQIAFEALGQGTCLATDDFAEGRSAFLEKRSPRFVGR